MTRETETRRRTIVAIGEAVWDVFPDGRRPGGAPCNVAYHASLLGDRGVIVTRLGNDPLGDELVAFLGSRGVDTSHVQRDATRPTGTVAVTLDPSEPRFAIIDDVAWDYLVADRDIHRLVRGADAVCVGTLAQRRASSRTATREVLEAVRGQAMVVFDANLRPPFVDKEVIEATLRMADVVKVSAAEVSELSTLLRKRWLIAWLIEELGVRWVCVTRGKDGASMTTGEGTIAVPGVDVDTTDGDTVGSGDAFTAALTHEVVRNATPARALDVANRYAAVVATKPGAMPELSEREIASSGL